MDEDIARWLENALICGVISWFLSATVPYFPIAVSLVSIPVAFFAHLAGIGFALSVVRTRPYAGLCALGLNLSIWLMVPWRAWSMFYS